jgi:hypothetical protein
MIALSIPVMRPPTATCQRRPVTPRMHPAPSKEATAARVNKAW